MVLELLLRGLAPVAAASLMFLHSQAAAIAVGACGALGDQGDAALVASNIERFPAQGEAKRIAVVIVHGSSGLARFRDAYSAYARLLASHGISAYLVDYYTEAEARTMTNGAPAEFDYPAHVRCWIDRVSRAVDAVGRQESRDREVALLGFSQGARLSVAVASMNRRVAALATLYGRLPREEEMPATLRRLPPLLNLHGSQDQQVPLQEGQRLVEVTKKLGGPAELVVYPGEGHGFDFAENTTSAADAHSRILSFFLNRATAGK